MEPYDSEENDSEEFELVPKTRRKQSEPIPIPETKAKKARKPLTAKQLAALKKGQAIRDRNRLMKQKSKLTKIKTKEEELEDILPKEQPDYLKALAHLSKENKKLKKAVKKKTKKYYDSSSSDDSDSDSPIVRPKRKPKKEKAEKVQPHVEPQHNPQVRYMDSLDKLLLGLK